MINNSIKFDFNDILIVPKINTTITSRYKDIILPSKLPLFTAPMDTVVNLDNMNIFLKNKINVCLPRTIKYNQFQDYCNNSIIKNIISINDIHNIYSNVFISLGFEDLDKEYRTNFKNFHKNAHILIDVANGHMQKIVDYAREIKRLKPDIILMVGNIANPQTYIWYAKNNCVDYIRISIGTGQSCLTTKNCGVGFPIASLIREIYEEKEKFIKAYPNSKTPAIIADGGMKDYSDIIKAIGIGADFVMCGSIFNKAFESSGDNYLYGIKLNKSIAKIFFNTGFPIKKYFRGMSTKEAQKAMGKTNIKTSEGVLRYRKVEYHLKGWVENFEHYLRSAMSYTNAKTLDDFIGKVDICQITKNAHDRFNK